MSLSAKTMNDAGMYSSLAATMRSVSVHSPSVGSVSGSRFSLLMGATT